MGKDKSDTLNYKRVSLKKLEYYLFAFMFRVFRLLPLNDKKIVFFCWNSENFEGSHRDLYEAFVERNQDYSYYVFDTPSINIRNIPETIGKLLKFYFKSARRLATSRFIFLWDNFMPLAYLNFNKHAIVVQLWHNDGVFKKFGQDIAVTTSVRRLEVEGSKKFSYVVASSENTAPIYANAFGVSTDDVLPFGSVRIDRFFKSDPKLVRREFDRKYPTIAGKKIVLIAPTFRDERDMDEKIIENIDPIGISKRLGEKYVVFVRLHPKIRTAVIPDDPNIIDVNDYPDLNELIMVSDILITDYSSIAIDFAVLDKPIILYPYDYDEYTKRCRQLYFDYDFIGGTIVSNQNELIRKITEEDFDMEKIREFADWQHPYRDGKASERLVKFLIG